MGAEEEESRRVLDYSARSPGVVPRYRWVLSGVLIGGGVVVGVAGLFAGSEAARGNVGVTGCGLVVYGLVIRYQRVRL